MFLKPLYGKSRFDLYSTVIRLTRLSTTGLLVTIALVFVTLMTLSDSPLGQEEIATVQELLERGCLTFGYQSRSAYYCEPFNDSDSRGKVTYTLNQLWQRTRARTLSEDQQFEPIPSDSLPAGQRNRIGETVTFVTAPRNHHFVISDIGEHLDVCGVYPVYRLHPLDSSRMLLPWDHTYVVFAQDLELAPPVTPFHSLSDVDDSMKAYEQQLKDTIAARHQQFRWGADSPIKSTEFAYYVKDSSGQSDSVFMTVKAFYGDNMNVWNATYLAIRAGGGWIHLPLIQLTNRGWPPGKFDYVSDLNGDGSPEYVIQSHASVNIYNIIDGKLVLVAGSGYRGC